MGSKLHQHLPARGGFVSGGSTPAVATGIAASITATSAPSTASVTATSTPGIATTTITGTPGAITTVTVSGIELLEIGVGLELEVLAGLALGNVGLKEIGDLLIGLEKSAGEDTGDGLITLSVKRGGKTAMTNAAGTTFRRELSQYKNGIKWQAKEGRGKYLPMRWVYSSMPPWSRLGRS